MREKKETWFTIYVDGEKEKLRQYSVDLFSKRAIKKFSVSGEFADSEQVAADILVAKEFGGYIFAYMRKKEVRAVCVLAEEECRYVVKGFHVARTCTPSAVEKYRRLFVELIEEYVRLADGGVLAYVWGEDVVPADRLL